MESLDQSKVSKPIVLWKLLAKAKLSLVCYKKFHSFALEFPPLYILLAHLFGLGSFSNIQLLRLIHISVCNYYIFFERLCCTLCSIIPDKHYLLHSSFNLCSKFYFPSSLRMSFAYINYIVMIALIVLPDTATFIASFFFEPSLKRFFQWVETVALPAAMKIRGRMHFRVSWRKSALKDFQFLKSRNPSLQDLGSEKISYFLRASLVVCTCAMEDIMILQLFLHVLCNKDLPVTLLNSTCFL